jgi:hypothetical protein
MKKGTKLKRTMWTDTEVIQLRVLYPVTYTATLAQLLNRSQSSVNGKASELKLYKCEAFRAKELAIQGKRLRVIGAGSKFKKGQVPLNKGKKQSEYMTAEAIEKTKATQFKKGQLPHNTTYDGHERICKDGYIEVRISLGVYKAKHRLLWEQHNGAIPHNMIVVFKDKNKKNIVLTNLEMITKNENMRRNSIVNIHPELRKTHELINKLNKKIKSYGTN